MTTVRKWPVIGFVLAIIWLFVRGITYEPMRFVATMLVGLPVGLAIAYLTRDLYGESIDLWATLSGTPAAIRYLGRFLWELLTANLDVAYRVLAPSLPIDPDVVAVPLRVESDGAITTIANSITLTPGTLTMEYDDATNTLFVHAITGNNDVEGVLAPIRAWEDLALVIFDEEADPADPAPEWPPSGGDDGGE
ncbi:Na+/H+ antiporter subunit E [Halocatena halophila]|uniref:Na+/H+ antiporter subunit E n=1 Tax=Halocatena halophila TaxID=2814576 RepID=UPI002ED22788